VKAVEVGDRMWTPAQVMVWVVNSLGNFVPPCEILSIIDGLAPPGERERTMFEAFARLRLPVLREGEDGETAESPSRFAEPALSACWRAAEQAMLGAVRKGSLPLFGRPREGARIEPISRLDRQRIQFKEDEVTYAELADGRGRVAPARSHTPPPYWDMTQFNARDVVAVWPHPDDADRGGRPGKYDWAAIEAALEEECRLQASVPIRNHTDKQWRTKADAMRYLRDRFKRKWSDGGPGDTTLKDKIGPMLRRIGARMKKAGN
jgi:hypothetical protein